MANIPEPGQLVLTLFDSLINRIKSAVPQRTDGKSLTTGYVYSQLVLGMPIAPEDFSGPWTPAGGATLQDSLKAQTPVASGSTTSSGSSSSSTSSSSGTPTPPTPDPKFQRAMNAAFNTAQLVDTMIMVTNDNSYVEYPTTRHVSFAYDGVVNGMQSMPAPPIPDAIQQQINNAQKVLYDMDDQGNIIGKSQLYRTYLKNALAYAQAKANYADAQAAASTNPQRANTWPVDSATYQQAVDQAWDTFKTEGAVQVEQALDVTLSVGVNMQDHMIAKARQLNDEWNLGLSGVVPASIPYSYILPSSWSDPDADDDGWQELTISQSDYQGHTQSGSQQSSLFQSSSSSSSTGGGVGVFAGFIDVAGGVSGGSSGYSSSGHGQYASQNSFHNDATGLSIDLEYALLSVERPWLVGDLFYLQNWYLVNNKKNAISDGTVPDQVKNASPLLPMIPEQLLAIRNVTITATDWGSDGQRLSSYFGDSASSGSSSSVSGSGGFSLGFINFGATHSQSSSQDSSSSDSASSSSYDVHFDSNLGKLSIHGTQIIAWLSDIVPACAPLDDPGLKS